MSHSKYHRRHMPNRLRLHSRPTPHWLAAERFAVGLTYHVDCMRELGSIRWFSRHNYAKMTTRIHSIRQTGMRTLEPLAHSVVGGSAEGWKDCIRLPDYAGKAKQSEETLDRRGRKKRTKKHRLLAERLPEIYCGVGSADKLVAFQLTKGK